MYTSEYILNVEANRVNMNDDHAVIRFKHNYKHINAHIYAIYY